VPTPRPAAQGVGGEKSPLGHFKPNPS
jgi:hypothetical protein